MVSCRALLSPLVLALLGTTAVLAEQHRVTAQTVQSEDSDHARQQAYYLKYRHTLDHPKDEAYLGAGIGTRRIRDTNGTNTFEALTAEARAPLSSIVTFRADATKYFDQDWSPWSASTALIFTPAERVYIELFAERDIVDTSIAIDREIRVNTYGLSGDIPIARDWTLVGAGFRQTFDDGNVRNGAVARLIWEIPAVDWLVGEIKAKQLDTRFNGFGYFSPDKLREDLLLLTARKVMFGNNVVASLQIGGGRQTINNDFDESLYLVELKARGWMTSHWGFDSRAGCKNTGDASFTASTDNYRYCYADLELFYAW